MTIETGSFMIGQANTTTEDQIATLNSLLRGEMAAVEAYEHALSELDNHSYTAVLIHIKLEHVCATEALRRCILDLGGEPDTTAGGWGALTSAVEITAATIGNRTAVRALIIGERSGAASYEEALSKGLLETCAALIDSKLLPRTRDHITILEYRLIG